MSRLSGRLFLLKPPIHLYVKNDNCRTPIHSAEECMIHNKCSAKTHHRRVIQAFKGKREKTNRVTASGMYGERWQAE
jgi:hypothetical protein